MNNYRLGIACVLQEDRLFSGSLIDNISGFDDNVDLDFVMECAKRCNIHDEIMRMSMGYESIIGELGLGISGGQKQRIAIARAILKDPRILILDEATSALDTESEKIVQEALDRLMVGRTAFVIAHRLSTIQDADKILVLDKGDIVESGTHQELMAKHGLYAKLHDIQFKTTEI